MISTSIARGAEESKEHYHYRLYEDRVELGLSNQQVADLLNAIEGTNYDESKFRKEYQAYKNVWEKLVEEKQSSYLPDDYLREIELEKIELQKEKFKFRDQKREFNNTLRKMARLEHLQEYLIESVEQVEPIELPVNNKQPATVKEAMVVISDMHLGMQINSQFNTYNKEIALERLNKLKERTYQKIVKEGITTLHIASLGDQIHGLIHSTTRITSEENVIQQIITASEYFKAFVETFLQMGIQVKFYNISGNHSRAVANKNDSLGTSESFERLISTILTTAFDKFSNFELIDDSEGLIVLNISGKNVVLGHGDLDRGANAITKLQQLLGINIHYFLTGHVHHHFVKEHGITVQYGVGSMCGLDQYAITGRFSGRPSQMILTFNDTDIEEAITVYLD